MDIRPSVHSFYFIPFVNPLRFLSNPFEWIFSFKHFYLINVRQILCVLLSYRLTFPIEFLRFCLFCFSPLFRSLPPGALISAPPPFLLFASRISPIFLPLLSVFSAVAVGLMAQRLAHSFVIHCTDDVFPSPHFFPSINTPPSPHLPPPPLRPLRQPLTKAQPIKGKRNESLFKMPKQKQPTIDRECSV